MAVHEAPIGVKPQFVLDSGLPAVGNKLFFYQAGSSTKQDTFTDWTGASANSNPLTLNSLGETDTQIWFTAGLNYKVVYAPSNDTDPPTSPIWTIDNLRGINDTTVTADQWLDSGFTPTFVSATSFSVLGDQTSVFQIGRRLKSINSSGTIYSTITNSVFGAVTTVTVTNDSGVLDSGLSSVSYGILSSVNDSMPRGVFTTVTDIRNQTHIAGTTGGTSTAYSLTLSPAVTAYVTNQLFFVRFNAACGAAPTLSVNGLAARNLRWRDSNGAKQAFTAGQIPVDWTSKVWNDGTDFVVLNVPSQNIVPRGYIAGFTYANNGGDPTNDIDIAAGAAMDDTGAYYMTGAALTKRSDATFTAGNNGGMLDTGAIGDNEYYIFVIQRPDTLTTDYLCSLSSTAPTMPASYTLKRLIGYFARAAGSITAFTTFEMPGGGLDFRWNTPTLDINLANTLTGTRRTDAIRVPKTFSVMADINASMIDGTSNFIARIGWPGEADAAPSSGSAPLANMNVHSGTGGTVTLELKVRTSSTGTIFARTSGLTVDSYAVSTLGFEWARR